MNEESKDIKADISTTDKPASLLFKIKNSALVKRLSGIKNIKAIVAVIVFVVVALIVINVDFTSPKKTTQTTNATLSTSYTSSKAYVDELERKLTNILGAIKGAGNTRVMITIESGPQIEIASNVEEKTTTTSSGNTVTVMTTPILIDSSGTQTPLVTMEIVPKVKGVIVVSAGANDIRVRLDMLYAVQALLDVPNENIQIFAGS